MIDDVLAAAGGFSDTGEQDRYDKCESAMTRVLHEIRLLARQWKVCMRAFLSIAFLPMSIQGLLPKNKYYVALGSVVDAGLSRVLDDILALPDIPEVESHRLSELCRILNTLEGLFVEDTNQVSRVHVVISGVAIKTACSLLSMSHPGSSIYTFPSFWSV